MLTLQELKQVVSNREERRKVPSAKYLRENEVAVAKQRLMDCAEIIAYQTGYVLYCVGDYATVFPLFTCRDYVYEAERKIAVVEENFFDDQPWYVRLILEGEDRLWRNRETREHNNCVSYSCISEEWCELADKGQCLLEKIIAEETVRELMDLLTERQRQMIQRIYFQHKKKFRMNWVLQFRQYQSVFHRQCRKCGIIRITLPEHWKKETGSMPGKKPKERQRYMLRINDTLVEVTREVYLAWYQAGRKERYQVEKMQRHGVCSMEELQEKGYDCSFSVVSPEEIVIRLSEIQELEEALGYLTKEDAELITLLFFEEFTVKETAQYFGCCPKTIRNRRKKVLEKLKEQLENT